MESATESTASAAERLIAQVDIFLSACFAASAVKT
jgi:hypothetical protein